MLLVLFRVIESRPYPGETEGGTAVLAVEQGAKDGRIEIAVDTDAALALFRRNAIVEARFNERLETVITGDSGVTESGPVPQGDGDSGETSGAGTQGDGQ